MKLCKIWHSKCLLIDDKLNEQVIDGLLIVGEPRMCPGLVGWPAAGVDILAESQPRARQHTEC